MTIVERELVQVVCPCCGLVVQGRALSAPVSAWCEVLTHTRPSHATTHGHPLGHAVRCLGSGDVAVIPKR